MSEQILDEKLVHLKQRLEILQSVYLFFNQAKPSQNADSCMDFILKQMEKEVKSLISEETKLTVI